MPKVATMCVNTAEVTVKPVLSGCARGMVGRIAIQIKITAEKTVDLKLEAFIFGVLMICEHKQGNQSLHLLCYIISICMKK